MLEKLLNIEKQIQNKNYSYDSLGKGTMFVVRLKDYGDLFWLHTLFYPLSENKTEQFKNDILERSGIKKSKLLDELVSIYKKHNGANLFSNSFILFGYTEMLDYKNFSEPNSIISNNNTLRIDKSLLAIGYYSIDSSSSGIVCIDLKDDVCFAYNKNDPTHKRIKVWKSIEELLTSTILFLAKHYDTNGYKIGADPKKPLLIRNKTYL